jgi:hypothetical protein
MWKFKNIALAILEIKIGDSGFKIEHLVMATAAAAAAPSVTNFSWDLLRHLDAVLLWNLLALLPWHLDRNLGIKMIEFNVEHFY